MQFTIGTITRCSGGQHYQIPVTINNVTRTLHTSLAELQSEAPNTAEEAREAILARIRSALLESDARTFAQLRQALETESFHI